MIMALQTQRTRPRRPQLPGKSFISAQRSARRCARFWGGLAVVGACGLAAMVAGSFGSRMQTEGIITQPRTAQVDPKATAIAETLRGIKQCTGALISSLEGCLSESKISYANVSRPIKVNRSGLDGTSGVYDKQIVEAMNSALAAGGYSVSYIKRASEFYAVKETTNGTYWLALTLYQPLLSDCIGTIEGTIHFVNGKPEQR